LTVAAAYIRESTVAQGDRYGPDAQRSTIARAAADLDLELVAEYSDLISGTGALKRSDFQRMVADARERRFSVLVVYDTSRFARNEADAFTYEAALRTAGARIYYAREGLWSDDRRGALQKGILHVLNAQYSRDLTDRIRDGYAAKFARLGLPGGTLPWGYRWTDATATGIVLIDDEAAIRRELLELYATGNFSAKSLAEELNKRGHRARGRSFDAAVVYEALKNPLAIGVTRRKGEQRTGVAPVLVERRTWDAIQRLLRERRGRRGEASRRAVFVFSSRARHAACGRALWGHRKTRPGGLVDRRLVHSPPNCSEPFQRSEAVIEAAMLEWLKTWQLPNEARTRLRKFLGEADIAQDVAQRRRNAEQRLERARKLFLIGDLDEKTYAAEKRKARTILDETTPAASPTLSDAGGLIDVAKAWPDMRLETRRAIVEQLTTEIRFGDEIELVIRPELRRMVAAIAAPEVHADLSWARDGKGRFASAPRGLSRGPGWIRTSDPSDVNRVL
jgi:DNA invertase Pin-like site-specific DNA recombinase